MRSGLANSEISVRVVFTAPVEQSKEHVLKERGDYMLKGYEEYVLKSYEYYVLQEYVPRTAQQPHQGRDCLQRSR